MLFRRPRDTVRIILVFHCVRLSLLSRSAVRQASGEVGLRLRTIAHGAVLANGRRAKGSGLASKQPAQFRFCSFERPFSTRRQVSTRPIDVQVQHRHGRSKRVRLATVARLGGPLQRFGDLRRIFLTEYVGLEIERIGIACQQSPSSLQMMRAEALSVDMPTIASPAEARTTSLARGLIGVLLDGLMTRNAVASRKVPAGG